MLDTLTDMEVANTIMKTSSDKGKDAEAINLLDKRFSELNMGEMTPLDHKSSEYKALADYLIKSSGSSHGIRYRLEDIFRVSRQGEKERFEKSEFSKVHKSDKRLVTSPIRSCGSQTDNLFSCGMAAAPPTMVVFSLRDCVLHPPRLLSMDMPLEKASTWPTFPANRPNTVLRV